MYIAAGTESAGTVRAEYPALGIDCLRFLSCYGFCAMYQKNVSGCRHEEGYTEITDRHGNHFKVRMRCRDCYNVIYNPVPLYLFDLQEEIAGIAPEWIRFQFTDENAEQTARILLSCSERETNSALQKPAFDAYTRGHFHRGIK